MALEPDYSDPYSDPMYLEDARLEFAFEQGYSPAQTRHFLQTGLVPKLRHHKGGRPYYSIRDAAIEEMHRYRRPGVTEKIELENHVRDWLSRKFPEAITPSPWTLTRYRKSAFPDW
jgi:hypothetical protein